MHTINKIILFHHRPDDGSPKLATHFAKYFIKIFLICYFFGSIALQAVFSIWPHLVTVVREKQNLGNLGVADIVYALALAPIIESAILVYGITISTQIVRNKVWSCFIGSIPVVALHIAIDWRVAAATAIPFALQGGAYINIRKHTTTISALLFVAGIHFCMNLINIAINLYRFPA